MPKDFEIPDRVLEKFSKEIADLGDLKKDMENMIKQAYKGEKMSEEDAEQFMKFVISEFNKPL